MARILIVDDAPFMRKLIVALVSDEGHQGVGGGKDGAQAVTLDFATRPDVRLIDLVMPRKDAVEATREILGRERNAPYPPRSASDRLGPQPQAPGQSPDPGRAAHTSLPLPTAERRHGLRTERGEQVHSG